MDIIFARVAERLRLLRLLQDSERFDLEVDLDQRLDVRLFEDSASFLSSGAEASSAAGSSRASSSRSSLETDCLLSSRPSGAATSGGDDSTPAATSCCLAGAPADTVGDSPMAA